MSKIFTKIAFGVAWKIVRHRNIFNDLQKLEQTQYLSREEIKEIQWNKLKNLLEHAYHTVPYYRGLFDEMEIHPNQIVTQDDIRKIPILTKEIINNNSISIISSKYRMKDLNKSSTGGSTGESLNFFIDKKTSSNRTATVTRNDRWAGLDIGDKNVRLWGAPFDTSFKNKFRDKIYSKLFQTVFMSSYNLSEENMQIYAKKLRTYKPKVIIGYSSSLYFFAQFLEENEIGVFSPKSIITSAEVLFDYQRELIEHVFGCEVFNRYGCREFSTIAQECSEHSGMHINAEHVYVECLKENGEPVAPGENGELVITDLDNYGMPFIRYKIGDVGVLSDEKCNCCRGLPLLEKLEGRTFDIIIGTNGRRFDGHFFSILLRTSVDGIKQFQVVQESKNELNIRIIVNEVFRQDSIAVLNDKIHEHCGEDMQINFKIVDKISLTQSGKFRFVVSKIQSNHFEQSI